MPFPCTACGYSKFKLREGTIVSATVDEVAPCGRPDCDSSHTTRVTNVGGGKSVSSEHIPCRHLRRLAAQTPSPTRRIHPIGGRR